MLKCPYCGETNEVYYNGDNLALCERCIKRFNVNTPKTKKQRKQNRK